MAEQGSPCLTEFEAKTVLARAEKVLEVLLISLRRYDVVKWEKLVYAIYLGPGRSRGSACLPVAKLCKLKASKSMCEIQHRGG